MNNKYKIGDKVRVKESLKGISCIYEIEVTIKDVLNDTEYVVEQENGVLWRVIEEDLQPYIEQETEETIEMPKGRFVYKEKHKRQ